MLIRQFLLLCGVFLTLSSPHPAAAVEPMRFVYPPPESSTDRRLDYYWDLLRAALDVTVSSHGPYEMVAHTEVMNAARIMFELSRPSALSVAMLNASSERDLLLLPVRIPLDKGLTGYRLFLIQAPLQEKLNKVKTLDDLQLFKLGQGDKWIDSNILRQAGFYLETSPTYDNLFRMLAMGRFDLFPRGVNEIRQEYTSHRESNPQLAIERNLVLYYPQPRYFYFRRNEAGERLANRVEEGLRKLKKSGEFEKRYLKYKQQTLEGINLSGRRVFRLENPMLSKETPLDSKELWDSLSKELKAAP